MGFEFPDPRPDWFPQASAPLVDTASLKKLYPDFLELKQLIVVHRHGERTPIEARFPGIFPKKWNLCEKSNQKVSLASDSKLLLYNRVSETQECKFIPSSVLQAATCAYGQLTDVGRDTLERNGQHLRKIYVEHLKFLPEKLVGDDLYLRTTDYPRTIESLQQLLLGLYPDFSTSASQVIFRSRSIREESMVTDPKCKRIPVLKKEHTTSQLADEWEALRKELIKTTALGPILSKPEHFLPLSIHKVYDTLTCALAHGMPIPKGVTPAHMKTLNSLEVKLWFGPFINSREFTTLGIGRIFSDIKDQFSLAIHPKGTFPKLAVFSGHDSTLGPLLIGLNAFDHVWPSFGSMVMFELFRDKKASENMDSDHFVRIKYNDKVLNLPQCQATGKHHPELGSTFCKLSTMFDVFRSNIPTDYHEQCNGFVGDTRTN